MKKLMKRQVASWLLVLCWPLQAGAIGYVYTGVGGDDRELLELTSVNVEVTIQDRVAVTRIDQVFTSHFDWQVEGIYEFALPSGAIITDLVLWIGEKRVQGIIMEKEEARRIYDEIVGRNIDPALIEQIDEARFRLSIFPFPAQGSRRVELEYTQVLDGLAGTMHYRFPLAAETAQPVLMQSFVLRAHVLGQHPFTVRTEGLFQQITAIEQEHELATKVLFADELVTAERDFELVITETGEQRLPRVLSYKSPGEELGYYALWLPPLELPQSDPIPRSITFVIDVSSSMRDTKLPPVKRALTSAIGALQADDFFNIIAFSNRAEPFASDPVEATAANKEAAVDFVQRLTALGATNFEAALRQALRQTFPEGRTNHVIFLTDGYPSEGETNLAALSQMVEELARNVVRIFAIGVGNDVNRSFLRALAEDHSGSSRFVSTEGDIETELRTLFEEFTRPIFLPTKLSFEGMEVHDVFPIGVDLLVSGQELFQVGRYLSGGPFMLKLEGRAEDQVLSLEYPLEFAAEDTDQPLIPRLWAHQKVQALEGHIARFGPQREVLDDILDLGLTYRLVTRRTSLFAPDDDVIVNPEPRESEINATAVEETMITASWHGKSFYLRDETWIDLEFEVGMPVVKYDSTSGQPAELNAFALLRQDMIVVWKGTAYVLSQGVVPTQLVLLQNVPNPFNSGTVIRFALSQSENIELAVYNLAGQQVAILVNGVREAGTFKVRWDGRDDQEHELASGVYLYRLQAGAQVETRKLLLLR